MGKDNPKSRKRTRGEKTLCLRVTESKYQEIIDDKAKFKQYLQENLAENPERFPPEIEQGGLDLKTKIIKAHHYLSHLSVKIGK